MQVKFFILLFLSCTSMHASSVTMTVFVHGTRPALKLLDHKASPFRYLIHADPGLNLASKLPKNYHFYKAALGCHERDCVQYNLAHFYMYGWHSSNLRPAHRKAEGLKLYQVVNQQVEKYRMKYDKVIVRFIGSSHGGNVVLNAVACMPFSSSNVEVELILMGTPVQKATQEYINSPCIDRAFSFYSTGDWIQRIDMQKFHKDSPKGTPLLSSRLFDPQDHVTQIELKLNGKSIGHGTYRSLFQYLPDMMRYVLTSEDYKNGARNLCLNFVQ